MPKHCYLIGHYLTVELFYLPMSLKMKGMKAMGRMAGNQIRGVRIQFQGRSKAAGVPRRAG